MTVGLDVRDAQGRPVMLHKEINHDDLYAFYTVERRPEVVAKIAYDPLEPRQAAKLSALTAVRTTKLEDSSAWPLMTLHDRAGKVTGFMMVRLDGQDYQQLREYFAPARITPRNWAERLKLATNLAQAFAALHAAGQVCGNVNGRQILVSGRGQVRLVNVDSYQARMEGQVIPAAPNRVEYIPPELQGKGRLTEQTQNHDLFGLAVLIFHLLMAGQHPYSGVPTSGPMPSPSAAITANLFAYSRQPRPGVQRPAGGPSLDTLSPTVQELFERAFAPVPGPRPTANEWHTALLDMQSSLEACDVHSSHTRVHGQPCQQCQIEAGAGGEPQWKQPADLKGSIDRLWQQVQAVRAPDRPASTGTPELAKTTALPPLPLNLPNPPPSLLKPQAVELLFRWVVRLSLIALIFLVVYTIQKSVLAAIIEIGILVFLMTLGRRFSVDWDGMIVNFQNWEGRILERFLPGNRRWEAYYGAVDARRKELQGNFKHLRAQYQALEEQYRDRNAFARYQAELTHLDQRRRRLLQFENQGDAVQHLISEYRQEALTDYLRQQPLQPGIVPELTSKMALHLSTMGIRRASDLQPEKLKVVRPQLAKQLTEWRDDLVQFFQFSENSIPPGRLAEARQKQQMHQRSDFRQFEQDARRFMNTDWQAQEHEFLEEMQNLKAQAKQHQQALKALDGLAAK